MIRMLYSSLGLLLFSATVFAQSESTAARVYQIFQSKCVNCHSNVTPRAGLDLEGTGATESQRLRDVYDNLVGIRPANQAAVGKGYQLVMPGRADKSFLFKKINDGLDRDLELEEGENASMPLAGSLTDVEKELIRQWILFGAPMQTEVVKEQLLVDYYERGMARSSFPNGAPDAPNPSEGFQIKMGPFFIDPAGEDEYFAKYQLDNIEELEVKRLDIKMSNFSHHFIIYDYDSEAAGVPNGFRRDQDHTEDVSFVATVQESQDIILPRNTAFRWGRNHVLDLNSHTINYTTDFVYQNEVYINVYTQPMGTAKQEMLATLIPNPWIYIPNSGNEITHSAVVQSPSDAFVWNIGGHTHQYGTSYKIWKNNEDGERDELIYDASCPRGVPDCVAPFFDYQHIPNRTFEEFLHIDFSKGVTHEAKWINDGPNPVWWGSTSQDEMMLFGMLYVTDTTGLSLSDFTTSTIELEGNLSEIKIMPNPMRDYTTIQLPSDVGNIQFQLHDVLGNEIMQVNNYNHSFIRIERNNLPQGLYLLTIRDEKNRAFTGKIFME